MNNREKHPDILKNLGPKTTEWLAQIGITTSDEILRLGSVEVYVRLKHEFPRQVTLNALYGLEAAIMNIRWLDLPIEIKEELRAEAEIRLKQGE